MLTLEGLTVVSLEQAVAAPFATRQLADLGARVIKVERPGPGDFARGYDETVKGMSSHFVWLNRSKESIALDLKSEEGRAAMRALVARADVFVQNLAPGAAERLGLGAEQLRARHPQLIHASISGYGDGGPYTTKKAYDLLVQCEAGLVSITGTPEEPSKVGISVADIAAGMYAYTGILTALLRRHRTQEGATVEISMLEALAEWMGFPLNYAMYGGSSPTRSGASHAAIAPYGPFHCRAGEQAFLGIQNEREWAMFCATVLEMPELADDPRFATNTLRVNNREVLTGHIEGVFAGQAGLDTTLEQKAQSVERGGNLRRHRRRLGGWLDRGLWLGHCRGCDSQCSGHSGRAVWCGVRICCSAAGCAARGHGNSDEQAQRQQPTQQREQCARLRSARD